MHSLYSRFLPKLRSADWIWWILILHLFTNRVIHDPHSIHSDGVGYYDYLPSAFYYHDFLRQGMSEKQDSTVFQRIRNIEAYVDHGGFYVNKYTVGTAVLLSPFYAINASLHPHDDPYSLSYQRTVRIAALFYLALALVFLRKWLKFFMIQPVWIWAIQGWLVLATPLFLYSNAYASYSHVYSLFAIVLFLYCATSWLHHKNVKSFQWGIVWLGLIILLRPVNALVVLALPMLSPSLADLWSSLKKQLGSVSTWLHGIGVLTSVVLIQGCCYWMQSGSWWVDSYRGEHFDLLHPHFTDILWSYKKGLWVYTPIAGIALLMGVYAWRKTKHVFTFFLLFFVVLTWILSSWWSWFYGCSFGLRAYIEFMPILLLPLALGLNLMTKWISIPLATLFSLTVPINLIQSYQYQHYLIHWFDMNQNRYWNTWLETEDRFKGVAWNDHLHQLNQHKKTSLVLPSIWLPAHEVKTKVLTEEELGANWGKSKCIGFSWENDFHPNNASMLFVEIVDSTGKNIFWIQQSILSTVNSVLNEKQTGYLFLKLPTVPAKSKLILHIAAGEVPLELGEPTVYVMQTSP